MPTDNMVLTLPTIDGSSGTWDTLLNAAFELIDDHDHSTGKGVKVTPSGLNINADLTFAGFAATNVEAVAFAGVATYTDANKALFVDSDDGELYWRNATGTNVQVTSGNSLNLSLVGGIAGDYAAASASFYYDDANKDYRALQSAPLPNVWASLSCGNLDLYEKASGIANRVRLSSPSALAASYALTFPAALPASTALVQVSSAGVMTFTNTIVEDVTLAANKSVTVSGTGAYKHGEFKLQVPALAAVPGSGWTIQTPFGVNPAAWNTPTANGDDVVFAIPLKVGDRIKSVSAAIRDTSGGAHKVDLLVYKYNPSSGANGSQVGSTTSSAGDGTRQTITVSGLTETIATGVYYHVSVQANATVFTTHEVYGIEVTYDRP